MGGQAIAHVNGFLRGGIVCVVAMAVVGIARAADKEIPAALQPWKGWVTWGDNHRDCPTPFNRADEPICFWPALVPDRRTGQGGLEHRGRRVRRNLGSPAGRRGVGPRNVLADGKPIAVLERTGKPFVRLAAEAHRLAGNFQWNEMPQRIALPKEIGILSLAIEGKAIDLPNWDADGNVWLKRQLAEAEEKDFLAPAFIG